MASNEQQKVAKRNSLGHSSHRRPSLLSAMKVYKDADEQKGNKSESNSRKSSMTPEIKVETSINDTLDSSSSRPLLLLHPNVMSTSAGGTGGSGGSGGSGNSGKEGSGGASDNSSRVRSSSFSRQSHEPLLRPVPESSTYSQSSYPPTASSSSSSAGSKSTLKTPPSYAAQRPAGRRNSFCVSREVKQKHSSLKTLGIFK